MMTPYIMAWHSLQHGSPGSPPVNRKDILNVLDKLPEVANWRASTGAIFIISAFGSQYIADKIRQHLPYLIFTIIPIMEFDKIGGYSDKETWDFIKTPKATWES